jgi:hypothetical protein
LLVEVVVLTTIPLQDNLQVVLVVVVKVVLQILDPPQPKLLELTTLAVEVVVVTIQDLVWLAETEL